MTYLNMCYFFNYFGAGSIQVSGLIIFSLINFSNLVEISSKPELFFVFKLEK